MRSFSRGVRDVRAAGNVTEPAGWGWAVRADCDLLDLAQHGKQMESKG